jgi:hypothetical protein
MIHNATYRAKTSTAHNAMAVALLQEIPRVVTVTKVKNVPTSLSAMKCLIETLPAEAKPDSARGGYSPPALNDCNRRLPGSFTVYVEDFWELRYEEDV